MVWLGPSEHETSTVHEIMALHSHDMFGDPKTSMESVETGHLPTVRRVVKSSWKWYFLFSNVEWFVVYNLGIQFLYLNRNIIGPVRTPK